MPNELYVELFVPDLERVKTFYGRLGFKVLWEQEQEKGLRYLVMRMANTQLNFYGGDERVYDHSYFGQFQRGTPCGYGVEIVIHIDDIWAYWLKVGPFLYIQNPGRRNHIEQELKLKPWGKRDFRIRDPNGIYLRLTEPIDWTKP